MINDNKNEEDGIEKKTVEKLIDEFYAKSLSTLSTTVTHKPSKPETGNETFDRATDNFNDSNNGPSIITKKTTGFTSGNKLPDVVVSTQTVVVDNNSLQVTTTTEKSSFPVSDLTISNPVSESIKKNISFPEGEFNEYDADDSFLSLERENATEDPVERQINEAINSMPKLPELIFSDNKTHFKFYKNSQEILMDERITQIARQLAETSLRKQYEEQKLGHVLPISLGPLEPSLITYSKSLKIDNGNEKINTDDLRKRQNLILQTTSNPSVENVSENFPNVASKTKLLHEKIPVSETSSNFHAFNDSKSTTDASLISKMIKSNQSKKYNQVLKMKNGSVPQDKKFPETVKKTIEFLQSSSTRSPVNFSKTTVTTILKILNESSTTVGTTLPRENLLSNNGTNIGFTNV